jgi:hypothetical protein
MVLDQLVIWFITLHQLVLIGPAIGQYIVEKPVGTHRWF